MVIRAFGRLLFSGVALPKDPFHPARFLGKTVELAVPKILVQQLSVWIFDRTSLHSSSNRRGFSRFDRPNKKRPFGKAIVVSAFTVLIALGFSSFISPSQASPNASVGTACQQTVTTSSTVVVTQSGTKCIIRFTSGSNAWTPPTGVTSVDYLVVGGGGGGGAARWIYSAGGGGGGRVVSGNLSSLTGSQLSIVVGSGGAGGTDWNIPGQIGGQSEFATVNAAGGGGGGSGRSSEGTIAPTGGWTGGGGGAYWSFVNSRFGATGTGGSSFKGGDGQSHETDASFQRGGGGGGAGGAGSSGFTGLGGSGVVSSITGGDVFYGGGGGGGKRQDNLSNSLREGQGRHGGGNGGLADRLFAQEGTTNSGGGGGGAATNAAIASQIRTGGAGGSGVVILSYTTPTLEKTIEANGARVGADILIQPAIQLRSSANANLSSSGVVVTAAVTSGTGDLSGATATTNSSGVAQFTNLRFTSGTLGTLTLTYSAPGFVNATQTIKLQTVPTSIYISTDASTNGNFVQGVWFADSVAQSYVRASELVSALSSNNVSLESSGYVWVNTAVTSTSSNSLSISCTGTDRFLNSYALQTGGALSITCNYADFNANLKTTGGASSPIRIKTVNKAYFYNSAIQTSGADVVVWTNYNNANTLCSRPY